MVHIWFIYGSFMVHLWFIYGLYMVYIWFIYMDKLWNMAILKKTGWWFPFNWECHHLTDELIFSRGVETANQKSISFPRYTNLISVV